VRVSVIPPHPRYGGNALFESRIAAGHQDPDGRGRDIHWMDYWVAFREKARRLDIEAATADLSPPQDADVVLLVGVPPPPAQAAALRSSARSQLVILVAIESALGREYLMNPANLAAFDAVITPNRQLVDNDRYFGLRPRAYDRSRVRRGEAFERRRVGCFVATHQPLHFRMGLGAWRAGWTFTPSEWLSYVSHRGELLSYRAAVAREFANYPPGIFDLYGVGWDAFAETRSLCRGVPDDDPLRLAGKYRFCFALENHEGDASLISERIWDALYGDAVPVYRGNRNIADYIPGDCYIDAAGFAHPKRLLDYLQGMRSAEWSSYREAGRRFLRSDRIRQFLPDACADDLLSPIVHLLRTRLPIHG
jgi:hypothetical protein